MTETLTLDNLETRREELLARLDSARSRFRDAKFKASMDDAFIPEMNEADELVRQLEQQLKGLQKGFVEVAAQKVAERDAARLALRRVEAVAVLKLLAERDVAANKLQVALLGLRDALDETSGVTTAIRQAVDRHRPEGDDEGATASTVFVKLAPAADFRLLDDLQSALRNITRTEGDIGTPAIHRRHAFDAIARALPEVRDRDVQKESGVSIDPAYLAN